MTEEERDLLRRLERLNSRQLRELVVQVFWHPADTHFQADCWYGLAELFAELAADLRQAGDDAAGVITVEAIEP